MKRHYLISLLFIIAPFSPVIAQSRLSLEQFLKMVAEQNPTLKIEAAKATSSNENARGLAIPPPMVGYMQMTDQSGSKASGVEINQMIPFPTKLSNDQSARKYEALAQQETLSASEVEISAFAKVAFVNLWVSQQRKLALDEKKQVLENHIKLSRASSRSDSFLRVHLLRAESEYDLLENEILSAEQEIKEKQADLGLLVNAEPEEFHPILEEPKVSEVPEIRSLKNSHQIESLKYTFESFKEREQESKSTWIPDIYLRYKQIGETQLMPKTSEVMVGISLPFLFPWEPSAASGKATAMKMQVELELKKQSLAINSKQGILFSRAKSLKAQLDNISHKLLPRAEKRMNLVHNLAPRDMETLQDHRETMEAFPELKLKALEIRIQYEMTIAELEKYLRGHE